MLWLWHRPEATAPIRALVWEPPYATGVSLEKDKKKKKKKTQSCKQILSGGGKRIQEPETQTWMATCMWMVATDLQRTSFGPFPVALEMGVLGWDLQHQGLLPWAYPNNTSTEALPSESRVDQQLQ